jgi:Spy/CpxP family protein refolding chaperone
MKMPFAFLPIIVAGTLAAQQSTQPGTSQTNGQQPGSNQTYSGQQPGTGQNYSGQQPGTSQNYSGSQAGTSQNSPGQPGTNGYSNQKYTGRTGANRSDYVSEYLARELNLTREQQMKVRDVFAETHRRAEALEPKMREERDALKTAVKTGNDREIDRILRANSEVNAEFEAMHVKAMAKVYTMLTPEQKTKFDQLDAGWFAPAHHAARTGSGSSNGGRS